MPKFCVKWNHEACKIRWSGDLPKIFGRINEGIILIADNEDDACRRVANKHILSYVWLKAEPRDVPSGKKFRIVDQSTEGVLMGYDSVERENAVFGYGRPISKDFKHIDDLEVNERTEYVFQTGAGKTFGRVIRVT